MILTGKQIKTRKLLYERQRKSVNLPKRRIAIMHPQFRVGGGSEAAPLWAIEALKKDYDVTLITMGKLDLPQFNLAYGTNIAIDEIRLIEIPIPVMCRKRFDAFRAYRLTRYCKRVAPDYDLIMSTYNVMDFGVKGLQFIADFSFDDNLRRSFGEARAIYHKDSIFRKIYLFAAELLAGTLKDDWKDNVSIANSDWSGRIMKEVFGMETSTIYPPVIGAFPDIPWEARENGFVCIGRLTPEKRIDRMIEIINRVRERGFDVSLHIVGKPGDNAYIQKLNKLASENSSWLFMEGGKFGREKLEFLAKHKYGIHGRDREPFGIAVAEMVKAGCITFAPADGGQTEVVNHPALLYDNVEAAVDKIERVIKDRRLSQELRQHLVRQGNKFSVEIFQKEIRILVCDFFEQKDRHEG
jgi:glycosyltransferase involved in cell wall biosynthesis